MQKWKILSENGNSDNQFNNLDQDHKINKDKSKDGSYRVGTIAIIGTVAMTGFTTPIYELPISYNENTVVANYNPKKEFEMESKMVSNETFKIYKELLDEKFKTTNDKLDTITSTLNQFIKNEAVTKSKLFSSLFDKMWKKIIAGLTLFSIVLGILEKFGVLDIFRQIKT